ncbi:hypothetical protein WDW37_09130 [Bdellovibrionota bacterium FG-1]
MIRLLLLPLFSVFAVSFAHADILFIDMNGSAREVSAAREAASARHEKLLVFPDLPDEVRREMAVLRTMIATAKKGSTASISAHERVLALSRQYSQSMPNLEKVLQAADLAHQKIASVVVSGHRAKNGTYFGTFIIRPDEEITDDVLMNLFKSHHSTQDSLTGIFLWSCYAGSKPNIEEWKKSWPQLQIIFGFQEQSPLGDSDQARDVLRDVLTRQSELALQNDLATASAAISHVSSSLSTSLSGAIGPCWVAAGRPEMSTLLYAQSGCPPSLSKDLLRLIQTYWDIRNATGYDDVPRDEPKNPLRQLNKYLYNHPECFRDLARVPSKSQVISLIHFPEVAKAFGRFHEDALREAENALRNAGAPADVQIPSLDSGKVTRHEFLAQLRRLQAFLGGIRSGNADLSLPENLKPADQICQRMEMMLLDMSEVPVEWL